MESHVSIIYKGFKVLASISARIYSLITKQPLIANETTMTNTDKQTSQPPSLLFKILHEPTVHFFLIAALIFAFYSFTQLNNKNVLELDQKEIDARIFLQEISTGAELNEEQRQLIAATYIQEQILVREAIKMNLDNDERIHDILAQKMRHVLSGNIIQPSVDELSIYYQENRQRYEYPSTVTVDELVFNTTSELSSQILTGLQAGAEPSVLLQLEAGNVSTLGNINAVDLANIFESAFASEVFAAAANIWTGPFISNRGQHWLRVRERTESKIPPLNELADQVRLEWLSQEEESRLQQEVDKLWQEYTIIIVNDKDEEDR
ncbi:MAG: hypothetical protein COA96_03770 [SAR86 cluster bacterium]|uniref:peptidylprolyl isomerase n=1 Tax=SAR86 cluster bacterium TaxID=2030880 RepID=A0A2A5B6W2_9GAMM|nr:MAG: hypothetical protein COA96_03770 [SAR86 cluster bacterium]